MSTSHASKLFLENGQIDLQPKEETFRKKITAKKRQRTLMQESAERFREGESAIAELSENNCE
jgi:hypothetical protein